MAAYSTWTMCLVLFSSTVLGVLPSIGVHRLSPAAHSVIEGICAGAMLAAAWLSLLVPALDSQGGQSLSVIAAVIAGYLGLQLLHNRLPHTHDIKGDEGPPARSLRRMWLIAIAVGLHNLPEGFAVGVGSFQPALEAKTLLWAIAMQNFPEGLIIALALRAGGVGLATVFGITALTALIEVVGGLAGVFAFSQLSSMLPIGLACAAGAMLFVVCREMLPECQREEESKGTFGIIVGICAVMLLRHFVA